MNGSLCALCLGREFNYRFSGTLSTYPIVLLQIMFVLRHTIWVGNWYLKKCNNMGVPTLSTQEIAGLIQDWRHKHNSWKQSHPPTLDTPSHSSAVGMSSLMMVEGNHICHGCPQLGLQILHTKKTVSSGKTNDLGVQVRAMHKYHHPILIRIWSQCVYSFQWFNDVQWHEETKTHHFWWHVRPPSAMKHEQLSLHEGFGLCQKTASGGASRALLQVWERFSSGSNDHRCFLGVWGWYTTRRSEDNPAAAMIVVSLLLFDNNDLAIITAIAHTYRCWCDWKVCHEAFMSWSETLRRSVGRFTHQDCGPPFHTHTPRQSICHLCNIASHTMSWVESSKVEACSYRNISMRWWQLILVLLTCSTGNPSS